MDKLLQLKIKALHTIGEAINIVRELKEQAADKEDEEQIKCYEENLTLLEKMYEDCIDCCLKAVEKK